MNIHTKLIVFSLILIWWMGGHLSAETEPPASTAGDTPAIIVIDPGHGGADAGIKGPQGSLEKALMLELARKIKARLVPDYEVRLTRDDDYQVALTARTAQANTSRAALMISLHAGASFSPRAETTTIYLHDAPTGEQVLPTDSDEEPRPEWQWRYQQARHLSESQRLGELLVRELGAMPSAVPIFMATDQLPVLAGANLPAVLVEFGDLTSAAGEKRFSEVEWQQQCAGAIAAAIRAFHPSHAQ